MEIRPLDVASDADMHAFYETLRSGETYERVDPPYPTEHALVTEFRHKGTVEKIIGFGVYDGPEIVGAGWVAYPLLDNLEKVWTGLAVPASLRGRGIGSVLVEHLADEARSTGRTTILCESWIPFGELEAHPYRRFAERHGFALANTEVRRDLALPVSDQRLTEIEGEIGAYVEGYELTTFEEVPDDLVESFCALDNLMGLEAPTGDVDFEEGAWTPSDLRELEEVQRKAGRRPVITVALDSDRTVVAFSTISVPLDEPAKADQWGTLVHREHRGRRLGLAVKARNLRVLQREYPDRTVLSTCNAEQNAYMVAINDRLGYKPLELLAAFQRKLDLT
jgi:GNAT superfamily N-acetyltransferase